MIASNADLCFRNDILKIPPFPYLVVGDSICSNVQSNLLLIEQADFYASIKDYKTCVLFR